MTNNKCCNCHSYNWQEGETPNVILAVPENIRCYTEGRETICVDACIADAIKHLWAQHLPTLNSCCGHNKQPASVVIPQDCDPQPYLTVLRELDPDRVWIVSQWGMTRIGWATHEYEIPLATCAIAPERIYALQAENRGAYGTIDRQNKYIHELEAHIYELEKVPDEIEPDDSNTYDYVDGWNACRRAAMLQVGNSPVIGVDLASGPDRSVEVRYFAPPGYVMVPVKASIAMIRAGGIGVKGE